MIRKTISLAPVNPAAVSVEIAAKALGIGRTHAYSLIKEQILGVVRLGRRTLVPIREIEALLIRLQKEAK